MLQQPINKNPAFTPSGIKRTRKTFYNRAGFTLLEFMTAISLVGVIFTAGITALISTMRFYNIEQAKNRAEDDLHLALSWIKKDAMQADVADTTGVPGQLTLRITDNVTGSVDTITYSVSGTILQRTRGAQIRDITELIDTANPPQYSTPSLNYLLVDMTTIHDTDSAQQRLGVMLHGRDRDTDTVGTPVPRWNRQP